MSSGPEDQPGQDQSGPRQPGPSQLGPSQPGPGQFGQGQFGQGQFGQGQFGQEPGMPPPPYGPPGAYGQAGAGWPPTPYGPPGPYGPAGGGWPPMAGRRTNSLAIAALCCAIGQAVAGPLAGIAAIVLGAMSLKQIQVSGEEGRGMATTGLVLGIVGLILFVFFVIFALAVFHGITTNSPTLNNLNG